jgi:hypothetical protein
MRGMVMGNVVREIAINDQSRCPSTITGVGTSSGETIGESSSAGDHNMMPRARYTAGCRLIA